MKVVIRKARRQDESRWRALWDAYMRFNDEESSQELTRHNWARIMDDHSPINALVAEDESNIIGIANYVLHESPWTVAPVCYLSDLIVEADHRGAGVGRLFVDWLVHETQVEGWSRLYWHAKEDNYRARALYDRYTKHDGCLRYCLDNPKEIVVNR